jgi:signal transduction histidine kinase
LLNGLDGRPYAVCGISTDITAAKRAEYDLRALAAELSAAEDQERRKFARDLHDSIGQTMSALKMDLERGAKEGAGVDAIRRALETVDNLIGQVRTMTFDLYPAMLDDLGLVPTLYTYAEQFSRRTKISSSVTEIGARRPLPMAATNYLFRAIRELLNNVAKHATAKEILIAIHWRQDAVRIAVADDGSGFDPQIALIPRLRRGLGLADIRERLRVMGGALMIESSPGSGSHVVLDVPIKEENLG